ncbi:DUF4213 domain-containing proteins [Vulcanisaeta sp. JCM 16159]|uniref:enolase N-terminal-like fold-containing protein n=1 Tax=Vulcanisaeta sp. JCM 16159 TaxID=1295371 RepID=UPI000A451B99|nr:DUF4213 domain-containing proteins [Vulcanisaeta sp. JCM 16159]
MWRFFSRQVAEEVLKLLGNDRVEVLDQCNCLNYTYVLINTGLGEFLGIAYTPVEDLRTGEVGVVPRVEELPELVINLDSLVRALGIALINAVSNYLVVRDGLRLSQGDLKSEILRFVKPRARLVLSVVLRRLQRHSGISAVFINWRGGVT